MMSNKTNRWTSSTWRALDVDENSDPFLLTLSHSHHTPTVALDGKLYLAPLEKEKVKVRSSISRLEKETETHTDSRRCRKPSILARNR